MQLESLNEIYARTKFESKKYASVNIATSASNESDQDLVNLMV